MTRVAIPVLLALLAGAVPTGAQEGSAGSAKTVDKSSPELMKQAPERPRDKPVPAGIAVSDEGVPADKPKTKSAK